MLPWQGAHINVGDDALSLWRGIFCSAQIVAGARAGLLLAISIALGSVVFIISLI